MRLKQFGGKLTQELLERYAASPNWKDGLFQNVEEADMSIGLRDFPKLLRKQFNGRKKREPQGKLPVVPFDKEAFLAPSDRAKLIWYGHSVLLMRMHETTILVDPMLGPDCSPIAPFATRRYSENTLDLIDAFPEIDVVLISHDHYDHLDWASIERLKDKTTSFFVALGVRRHLERWGVPAEKITEFDWWDAATVNGIEVTFTPTRHFSGRGLRDRFKSLWGGWVFGTEKERIWFSGDGGYGRHFKEIGERLGPFDFALMECGQYNDYWRDIHLFPQESVQAALDAKVSKAMPVHWAGFSLSFQHTWSQPAEDFARHALTNGLEVSFPKIGAIFGTESSCTDHWWLPDKESIPD